MTFGQIRVVQFVLFVALVACAGYVGFFLWTGFQTRRGAVTDTVDEPANPTSRQVELEQLDSDGNTTWTLTAAESVGANRSRAAVPGRDDPLRRRADTRRRDRR